MALFYTHSKFKRGGIVYQKSAVLDDIELGEDMLMLLGDDHFSAFVSDDYRSELEKMLQNVSGDSPRYNKLRFECSEELIDRAHLDILLELLEAEFVKHEDYLTMVTKLTEMVGVFLDTGRFEEVLEAYNALKSHNLARRFSVEASGAIDYYFHSPETIRQVVDAVRTWGRKDRDATVRLIKALRAPLTEPLLDQLAEEQDAAQRKFYLSVLVALGSDIQAYAVSRLNDSRWYVVRNMLYLVRECNCRSAVEPVRRLVKHENPQIALEAVRTLLVFKTPDAVPFLKTFLRSEHPDHRTRAVRLAGAQMVREAVPILTELLEKRDLLGTASIEKTEVVRALGSIGDPRAVQALMKIWKSHALFNRNLLVELKTEVFRNLDAYPVEAVRPLLEAGRSGSIPAVRDLCEQYLSRNRGNGVNS
ncbi:MAG: hypothetical protein OHK006_14560 [Thermodesulfovibrionales bacterium]